MALKKIIAEDDPEMLTKPLDVTQTTEAPATQNVVTEPTTIIEESPSSPIETTVAPETELSPAQTQETPVAQPTPVIAQEAPASSESAVVDSTQTATPVETTTTSTDSVTTTEQAPVESATTESTPVETVPVLEPAVASTPNETPVPTETSPEVSVPVTETAPVEAAPAEAAPATETTTIVPEPEIIVEPIPTPECNLTCFRECLDMKKFVPFPVIQQCIEIKCSCQLNETSAKIDAVSQLIQIESLYKTLETEQMKSQGPSIFVTFLITLFILSVMAGSAYLIFKYVNNDKIYFKKFYDDHELMYTEEPGYERII